MLVVEPAKTSSPKKQHEDSTTETAAVQEANHPSLNKDNGKLVCGTCLGPLEYGFMRKRRRRHTSEKGPTVEMTSVTVSRCPGEGHYRTTYPDEIIRNKQYRLEEIQSVLDGKNDYSLASLRTKYYWKSWYRDMLEAVVDCLWQAVRGIISKQEIFLELRSFLKELGECWLRYVLDLFNTGINTLCMFFDLLGASIRPKCGKLHTPHRNWGADTAGRGWKPSPGG